MGANMSNVMRINVKFSFHAATDGNTPLLEDGIQKQRLRTIKTFEKHKSIPHENSSFSKA